MRAKFKITLSIAGALLLGCTTFNLTKSTVAFADETSYSAYEKTAVDELLDDGAITCNDNSITITKNNQDDGIIISGETTNLKDSKFTLSKDFDFGNSPARYFIVEGLAQKKKTMYLSFYLDDSTESFVKVKLNRQKKDNTWTKTKNICSDISSLNIKGTHKLSFSVSTDESDSTLSCSLKYFTFTDSNLPTVTFDLDESQGLISEMNADPNHDTECYGNMTINVPDGFKSEYSDKEFKTQTYELDYIRGRGNSTWTQSKKPYKIKLNKKADLLGMGKNKHWVLLANHFDISLLRNKITYWLGEQLNMEFTPQCEFVDVVMNGQYLGSYYLSEQIRVDDSRVNIDDLEENEETKTATSGDTITGGYLLSMEPDEDTENPIITTDRGNRFQLESPSFEDYKNEAQQNYITDYLNKVENAIYGEDFKDEDGHSYEEYMDVDSAIDYYLMQEFSSNGDAFLSTSTYLYKKRNGKLYWGPLWDFDFVAWGATEYEENYVTDFSCKGKSWFRKLLQDEKFVNRLKERFPAFKEKLLEASKGGGQIDKYAKKIYESQKANYIVNEKYSNIIFDDNEEYNSEFNSENITFDSEVTRLKLWINERLAWFEDNLDDLKAEPIIVTFMTDKNNVYQNVELSQDTTMEDYMPVAPEKSGYFFDGWYYEVSTDDDSYDVDFNYDTYVSESMTVYAKWKKASSLSEIKNLAFFRNDYYMYQGDTKQLPLITIPFNANTSKVTWSSDDESIATVSDTGLVMANDSMLGDVTITAKVNDKIVASCTVHICEYDYNNFIEDIQITNPNITLTAGSYGKIQLETFPLDGMGDMVFASSNNSIVEVNNGYIYAKAPGTASVIVYNADRAILRTCNVTVKAKAANKIPAVKKPTVKKPAVKKPAASKTSKYFTVKKIKYKIISQKAKTVKIVSTSNKKIKKFTVPSTVKHGKTYKVIGTEKNAFKNCKKLTKIKLGKNIKSINKNTFTGCKKLKKVIISSKKINKIALKAAKKANKKVTVVTSK